ncbi:NACHT domain-containing protein [Streptomyces sp. NPDC057623]|uniref:NACHT domain-containing protein n=1 Tax=Streptomyces sp. NPDC057623 TaxID=3346187 RepID=UPI0036822BF6
MHKYRQTFTVRAVTTFAVTGVLALSLLALLAGILDVWSPRYAGRSVWAVTATLSAAGLAALLAWRTLSAAQAEEHTSEPALADRLAEICRVRERSQFGQLVETENPMDLRFRRTRNSADHPAGNRAGRLSEVASFYRGCETQRLVFLGEGGSGKTVTLIHLLLMMLEDRNAGGLVPWRFSLSRWDRAQDMSEWMAQEISRDTGMPPAKALNLVNRGLVLAMLDGLDEMDPPHTGLPTRAAEVVDRLNRSERFNEPVPFVLTCRRDTYEKLAPGATQLEQTVVVEMLQLNAEQVQDHLKSVADKDHWAAVITHLDDNATGRLAHYLELPWRLAMAVIIYNKKAGDAYLRDPADLTAESGIDDAPPVTVGRLVEELLDRPAIAGRAKRTRRTLATLAAHLQNDERRHVAGRTISSVDLVVHELWPVGGLRAPRYLTALLSLVLWIPAAVAATWVIQRMPWSPWLQILAGAVLGCFPALSAVSSFASWPHPRNIVLRKFRTPTGLRRLGAAAACGLLILLLLAATGASAFAAAYAVMFALILGCGSALAVRDGVNLLVLSTVALATGLLFGLGTRFPLGFLGASGGMLLGTAGGGMALVLAVRVALRGGAEPGYVRNPRFENFIRNDVRTACISGGMLALIVAALLRSLPLPASVPQIALVSVAAGFSLGFGFVAEVWRRHIAMLICCRGNLAFRLAHVLARAHSAGLLRRAGIAYQFRHLDLRDHFAAVSAEPTRQPTRPSTRFPFPMPSSKKR